MYLLYEGKLERYVNLDQLKRYFNDDQDLVEKFSEDITEYVADISKWLDACLLINSSFKKARDKYNNSSRDGKDPEQLKAFKDLNEKIFILEQSLDVWDKSYKSLKLIANKIAKIVGKESPLIGRLPESAILGNKFGLDTAYIEFQEASKRLNASVEKVTPYFDGKSAILWIYNLDLFKAIDLVTIKHAEELVVKKAIELVERMQ